MATITSANAVLMLSVSALYPSPQQIQGFGVDDVFDFDPLESAETQMGVDGVLSAGFVYVPIPMAITLKADSPSNLFFDTWWSAQQQIADLYPATGNITLSSIGRKYAMTTGWLKTFPPVSDAKRVLQARKFIIHWQKISPANIAAPVA
jgi:hypothetical protein